MANHLRLSALLLFSFLSFTAFATKYIPISVGDITVIIPVDEAPVATADNFTVLEDPETPVLLEPLLNDSDEKIGAARIQIISGTSHGALKLSADGRGVTYMPNLNSNELDSFTYQIVDDHNNLSEIVTATINITPVNDAPVASDVYVTLRNDTVNFRKTIYITDPQVARDVDGDEIYFLQNNFSSGTEHFDVWDSNEEIVLTYKAGVPSGTYQYYFHVFDNELWSETAYLYVTIDANDSNPVISQSNFFSTLENTALRIAIEDFAYDPDGDEIELKTTPNIAVVTPSSAGTVAYDNASKDLIFTPSNGFSGTVTLSEVVVRQISDGLGLTSSEGTLTIQVANVNNPPIKISNQTLTTDEDTAITFDALAWFNDSDGDTLQILAGSLGSVGGSVTITNDNKLQFTPDYNFNGTATVQYSVTDGVGGSVADTLSITVNPVNDAPNLNFDVVKSVLENTSLTISASELGSDAESESSVYFANAGSSSQGITSLINDSNLSFTPTNDFVGNATVNYTLKDPQGALSNGSFTVQVIEDDSGNSNSVTGLTVEPSKTVPKTRTHLSWVDNSGLSNVKYQVSYERTSLEDRVYPTTGLVTETFREQSPNYIENYRYYVQICDQNGENCGSETEPANIEVVSEQDVSLKEFTITPSSISIEGDITLNWTLEDNAPSGVRYLVEVKRPGETVFSPSGDMFYQTTSSASLQGLSNVGTYHYRVLICNNRDTNSRVYSTSDSYRNECNINVPVRTVEVREGNLPPEITGTPPAQVDVGASYSFTPTASDANNDILTFSGQNIPGWASLNASTGTLSGTPTATDVGTYSNIIITASDGTHSTSLTAFSINVVQAQVAPTISGTPQAQVDVGINYSFTPTASDANNDILTFSGQNIPGWASLNASTGTLSGTPTATDVGTYSNIIITASDGTHSTSLTAFSINVVQAQVAPTISGTPQAQVDVGINYSFTPTASDANNDNLTFSIQNKPAWSTFDTSIGALSGTPTQSDVGNYTGITISVTDGVESTSLPVFSITVNSMEIPAWAESGGSAQAVALATPTVDESTFNGATPGQAGVSGGGANYNVPIVIPPGRNGMQPSVSLNYSSRSGLGLAGVGWSLSAGSSISRCPKTVAQDGVASGISYSAEDRLCLDGQRLVPISGLYGQTDTTYTTEIDSLIIVTQTGDLASSDVSFSVSLPNGNVRSYGGTQESLVVPTGVTQELSWLIDKETDVSGNNTIVYEYTSFGNGEQLLSDIYYTGNAANRGDRRINFVYETAEHYRTSYLQGGYTRSTQRLQTINTYLGETHIREYTLNYVISSASSRPLLDTIVECGKQGTEVCREATSMNWADDAPKYVLEVFKDGDGNEVYPSLTNSDNNEIVHPFEQMTMHFDVNGDGVRDWMSLDDSRNLNYKFVNAEGAVQKSGSLSSVARSCDYNFWTSSKTCVVADYNLDGITDFYRQKSDSDSAFEIGFWVSDDTIAWTTTDFNLEATNEARVVLGASDYNGDGYPDLLVEAGSSLNAEIRIYWNDSTSGTYFSNDDYQTLYTLTAQPGKSFRTTAQAVGDINGDGIADLALITSSGRTIGAAISGFLLSGETADDVTHVAHAEPLDITLDAINSLVDVNGDGLPDWVGVEGEYGVESTWSLRLNKGDGSFAPAISLGSATDFDDRLVPSPSWTADTAVFDYEFTFKYAVKVMDLNGDGRSEILIPTKANLTVEGCAELDWSADGIYVEKRTYCGLGLLANYRNGKDSLAPIASSNDTNIYQFKAIYFNENEAGGFSVEVEDSGIYGSGNGTMVVDAYGKGLSDVVFTYGCTFSGSCSINEPSSGDFVNNKNKVFINRNYGATSKASPGAADYVPVDVLTSIDNGVGLTSSWEYSPLSSDEYTNLYDPARESFADGEHFNFASSMYVVASFAQSNGVGGSNETRYQYTGAVYNNQGRGFRGFKSITQLNMANGTASHTRFLQKFPYSSLVENQSTFSTNVATTDWTCAIPAAQNDDVAMKAAAATNCKVISYSENDWQNNSNHNIANSYLLYNANAHSVSYDLSDHDWVSYSHTTTALSDVDQFGNVKKQTSSVEDAFGTYSSTKLADYSQATREWPWRYESKTVVKHKVSPPPEGFSVTVSTDNDKVVKTDVTWNSDVRKPETVTVKHGETSGTGDANTATNTTTVTTTKYNDYGLPTSVDVTGNVCLGSGACSSSQTRRVLTDYTNSNTQADADGYFPFTISQLVETVNGLDAIETAPVDDRYLVTTTKTDGATGLPTEVSDVSGVVTITTYDALARPTRIERTGTTEQSIRYYSASSPSNAIMRVTTQQAGMPESREYKDVLGRTVRTAIRNFDNTDFINQDVVYNSLGQVAKESNPYASAAIYTVYDDLDASTTEDGYDKLGRAKQKVSQQTNGTLTTSYTYDGLQTNINVAASVASKGASTLAMSRTYNALQQLVKTVDANDGVTQYAYDGSGNPIVIEDAAGNQITARYDALGRKTYVNDPNQGQTNFTYNDFGELEKEQDANGEWIYYDMDLLGRVTDRSGNNGASASFDWDTNKAGLLTSHSVSGHSTTYTYDSAARVEDTTVTIEGTPYTTSNTYDDAGRPVLLQYPEVDGNAGVAIEYVYNTSGYLTTERNASSKHVYRNVTSQDAFGNITDATINAGGLTGEYSYSSKTGQMLHSKVGDDIHYLDYSSYDSYGNLLQVHNKAAVLNGAETVDTYVYDTLHRLTSSTYSYAGTPKTIAYDYDIVGNFDKKTDYSADEVGAYSYYPKSNKLQSVELAGGGTESFTYDSKGNQTHRNGNLEVVYNVFNKPVQINRNGSNIDLAYGADLMRYKQVRTETSGNATTYYIGKHFEVEISGASTKYQHYISDVAILNLYSNRTPDIVYTHKDRLGSTATMTDHNNNVVARRYFDPFGKPRMGATWSLLQDLNLAPTLNNNLEDGVMATRRGFTDHEHLDQAELIHMNGRVYDYNVGRFMSVDPVIQSPTNSQSINPYSYIMNNPLAGTDPTGYVGECETDCDMSDMTAQDISKIEVTKTGNLIVTDQNGDSFKVENVNGADVEGNFKGLHQLGEGMMDLGGQDTVARKGGKFNILGHQKAGSKAGQLRENVFNAIEGNKSIQDAYAGVGLTSAVDTFADLGFVIYDLASLGINIYTGNMAGAGEDAISLALDLGCTFVPGATGCGAAYKASIAVKNGKNYEVLAEALISGTTRSSHRRTANQYLEEALSTDHNYAQGLNILLGKDVVQHMRSGKGALKNPPGTEWHHPKDSPDKMLLLRKEVHRDKGLQDVLHSDGTGGFVDFFRN